MKTSKFKQVDFVTESLKKPRGGVRANSGRKPKPEHEKQKTVVIRIPENLLQTIELLKQGAAVNPVTNNQNSLSAEIEALKTNNERLVIERDKQYLRAEELQSQVTELKRQPDKLRAEITRLKHLENDCQALKATGERCNKPAKGKVNFHGVLINVCLLHQNQLMKEAKPVKPLNLTHENKDLIVEIERLESENISLKNHLKEYIECVHILKTKNDKLELSYQDDIDFLTPLESYTYTTGTLNYLIAKNTSGHWFRRCTSIADKFSFDSHLTAVENDDSGFFMMVFDKRIDLKVTTIKKLPSYCLKKYNADLKRNESEISK